MSFFLAPAASKARTRRSSETAGSLASILATRDWLERSRLASSLCESPWLVRHFFKLALKVSLSSTKAASSSVGPRNCRAEPTFHPAASSFFRLLGLISQTFQLPIDFTTVSNAINAHFLGRIIDLVDHTIIPRTNSPIFISAGQLSATSWTRILRQCLYRRNYAIVQLRG